MAERLLTSSEMKECDRHTIEDIGIPSRALMERAAESVVREIISSGLDISRTIVICGAGNNGGDGFAVARFLAQRARENGIDHDIKTFFIGDEANMSEGCRLQQSLSADSGIKESSEAIPKGTTLIIDAIFGIGLTREVSGKYKDIIDRINASDSPTVSVDIPSGINADTGAVMGTAVKADITVTFAAYKRGLYLYPGAELCGKLIKADIGIGTETLKNSNMVFTASEPPFPIPKRIMQSNKGTYGKVLIVGGAKNMAGAAYLSAKAAYRTGAGLVRIFTTEENRIILQTLLPEAVLVTYSPNATDDEIKKLLTFSVSDATAIVAGPGLSQSKQVKLQLEAVLENAKVPLIIDADGLNIMASNPKLWSKIKVPTIITPHMGEMSRLTGLDIAELKADPIEHCKAFAKGKNAICVMKDARTTVSDGKNIYLNSTGNSGLSKGGSGDVLTGVIGALLAQGMSLFEAACTGVFLHGKAGELASEVLTEYSLLARDIADFLPRAMKP